MLLGVPSNYTESAGITAAAANKRTLFMRLFSLATFSLWLLIVFVPTALGAQLYDALPTPLPDERFKADILLVVAHFDDETVISGYLARAISDEHKRVAVLFTTQSKGGGNAVSSAESTSLGAEREIEARQGLAFLGVTNVWVLDAVDTPGQDVLRALGACDHGRLLGQVVRFIRLTRPEVIITWLPAYTAGENHGDHQTASVVATEAFDLASDPTAFPEQVTAPRAQLGFSNFTEGLSPWQPQKIYYFSDAFDAPIYTMFNLKTASPFRKNFLQGQGPEYSNTAISPARHGSYARLTAEELSFHLTQGGSLGKGAIDKGDFQRFEVPAGFVFGKSLVGGQITDDIFQGTVSDGIPFVRAPGFHPPSREGISVELGGPWAFYRQFWKAHNIERLAALLPVPEVAIGQGERMSIPLLIHNDTGHTEQVTVRILAPPG